MQRSTRKLVHLALTAVGIGLVAISLVAIETSGARATQGPQQVQVVNTTSSPVPTAAVGTTQVAGTVAVSSLPSVSLAGGTVGIDPAHNAVRIASEPALQEYTASVDVGVINGSSESDVRFVGTVPANKSLLIETVSCYGRVPNGQGGFAQIVTVNTQTLEQFNLYLPMTSQGPLDAFTSVYLGTQNVRLYASPGSGIWVVQNRTGTSTVSGTTEYASRCCLSGHYVDAP